MKTRYRIKNIRTEEIEKPILSLDEIQSGSYKYLFCKYYIVLSRDQFSERYDKNGKEVYEKDILEYEGRKYLVDYCDGHFDGYAHGYFLLADVFRSSMIVGDIHENPELLGE